MSTNTNLYTYSGKIAFPDVAPSLMDIAISLSREGRYAGAGMRWWPVALHTFVVCDLLPNNLKLHGLLHDASEVITGDVPKPAKTNAIELFEETILKSIYRQFLLPYPTEDERKAVKEADVKTFRGEVYTVGTQALQELNDRCPEAETLIAYYINRYSYEDMLEAGGRVPIEFMRRYREYRDILYRVKL
jgi:hypothetical protein